jgi:hypothetical protein
MVTDTQKIVWIKSDNNANVKLDVYDGKIVDGKFVANEKPTQTITVPVSSFSF